ncbi:hypothetical protein C8R44DRAFT_741135 [Mycena epipterygia]|nr:hypothetical protein C8R44DRAFT_741135 [Mycena epipterygia]
MDLRKDVSGRRMAIKINLRLEHLNFRDPAGSKSPPRLRDGCARRRASCYETALKARNVKCRCIGKRRGGLRVIFNLARCSSTIAANSTKIVRGGARTGEPGANSSTEGVGSNPRVLQRKIQCQEGNGDQAGGTGGAGGVGQGNQTQVHVAGPDITVNVHCEGGDRDTDFMLDMAICSAWLGLSTLALAYLHLALLGYL